MSTRRSPEERTTATQRATVWADDTVSAGEEQAPEPADVVAPGERGLADGEMGERQVLGGRYELLSALGTGGMGCVYKARDLELDEVVALKVLRRELSDPRSLARFRREVKLARRVTHRNVARTYDIGEADGVHYLTMEHVKGESLAELLRRKRRLSLKRAVDIALQVAEGLQVAHEAGIVHRDLKPANVLIDGRGRVVLSDFGVARALRVEDASMTQGSVAGTPAYMAPEQVQGSDDIDGRADIYALGTMLFELLTGQRPWKGANVFAIATARLHVAPPDPSTLRASLPPEMCSLVQRCMAREPGERPENATELLGLLRGVDTSRVGATTAISDVHNTVDRQTPLPVSTPSGHRNVAVLPVRFDGPVERDYLAEGLHEDLVDTISGIGQLRVRPRAQVLAFRGDDDAIGAGRALGVGVVVEVSMSCREDEVRIRARLHSVADGFQLWARRFDVGPGQLLDISDTIATAIAEALSVQAATPMPRPNDAEVVQLYLRGLDALRKSWHAAPTEALALFDEALEMAPNDPKLLSGAAMTRAHLSFMVSEGGDRLLAEAQELAERALALSPHRGPPHIAMATWALNESQLDEALHHSRQAVRLSPNNPDAHRIKGEIVATIGPLSDARRHLERALQLDPGMPGSTLVLARACALDGDWRAADRLLRAPAPNKRDYAVRALVRARTDTWRRDPKWLVDFPRKMPADYAVRRNMEMYRGVLLQRAWSEEDRAFVASGRQPQFPARVRHIYAMFEAELHLALGEREQGMAVITEAVADGFFQLAWLRHCPLLAPLHGEPAMAAAIREVEQRVALAAQHHAH